jgi:hypothetical protein
MLTSSEAFERAVAIWGRRRVRSISLHPGGGGADVHLRPTGIASDTRDRNYSAHRLDGNGHVDCHDDCRRLES